VRNSVPSLATLRQRPEVAPTPADIDAAAALIEAAAKVAIFCGAGCRGAEAELIALSDRLRAPLMHSFRAKELISHDDPHWMGGVGLIGGKPGVDAVADAELLLMLGSDYPYSEFLPTHGNVIQIDERPFVLGRRTRVALGVTGSVRPSLRMLLDRLAPREDLRFFTKVTEARTEWEELLAAKADPSRSSDKIHPQALSRLLSDQAADDAVFVIDTGEVTLWAANWLRQSGAQRILASFNNAAVGTGMGMANGVQALDRDRQVILQVGDGGFSMLLGEFMTAVEHRLPVKVAIYDNGGWGLVHLEMEGAGLPAFAGAAFRNPDFAAYARACGAEGFTARDPATLTATIAAFLAAPGPAILHAFIDPNELPTLPHVDVTQAWRFGLAKLKEKFSA
jgi:pyruvate dehydrogenase (quinone)